jgi:Flp pilus assembly protein TadG
VRPLAGGADSDRGSAIVEFALISILLVFLLFAVVQVGLVFYVRSVVAASASDGARYGAGAGVAASAGGERAAALIATGLPGASARGIGCVGGTSVDGASGLQIVRVSCRGRLRSVFLPIGALVTISAGAQSLKEPG